MGTKLSEKSHICYIRAMPDDDFSPSDFDPPPHLMSPEDPAEYDAWFWASVEAALTDPKPGIPHEEVMRKMQAILDRHKT